MPTSPKPRRDAVDRHHPPNRALQPTAQLLRSFVSAELRRYPDIGAERSAKPMPSDCERKDDSDSDLKWRITTEE